MTQPNRPNLIVAGVTKGGTTSVFRLLETHPEIFGPIVKEPEFYLHAPSAAAEAEYAALYRSSGSCRYRLDSSASYVYGAEDVAKRLREDCPEAKVIIILRDPADRFLSFYNFLKHMRLIDQDESARSYMSRCIACTDDALSPADYSIRSDDYWKCGLRGGNYADFLPGWIDTFGSDLRIAFFDDLKTAPDSFSADLFHFLDLDPAKAGGEIGAENRTLHHDNALLHRVALGVYRRFGGLINRNKAVKRALLTLYAAANTSAGGDRAGKDLLPELKEYYAAHNNRLRQILIEDGQAVLPAWLNGEAQASGE